MEPIPKTKRKRRFWVISPNVTANERTVDHWKKAIRQSHLAFMGYGPADPKHKLGSKFADDISKGDVILIARRRYGNLNVVGFGIVSKDESVRKLRGFTPPDEKWRNGSIRQLSWFIDDPKIPPRLRLPLKSVVNHTRSLCKLHPGWKPEHRVVCEWMSKLLGLSDSLNRTVVSKKVGTRSGISVAQHTDPHQFEFTVRTREMVRQAKKVEDALVKEYREWLMGSGHHVDRITYHRFQCDAYDKRRNNLIEAKAYNKREYVRMAVGQLLDYSFLGSESFKNPHMAILLPKKPEPAILTWLEGLKISAIWRHQKEFRDNAGGQFT